LLKLFIVKDVRAVAGGLSPRLAVCSHQPSPMPLSRSNKPLPATGAHVGIV
jgi:hypothetical protein